MMGFFGTIESENSSNIIVSTGDINKDYEIIGIVVTSGSGGYRTEDWNDEIEKLKKAAENVGGNGVIYAKPVSDGKYHRFIGTAVKIK